MRTTTRRAQALGLAATTALILAGCSLGSGTEETGEASKEVVVATHDSWNMSKKVMRQFTEETGYTVKVQPSGDAGALTNKLVLTKNSPIADAVYGIDNTFASRAVDEGVLADYTPETNPGADFEPQDTAAAASTSTTPGSPSTTCRRPPRSRTSPPRATAGCS
jgi:thiamine transport system substrate-binding protein